MVPSLRFPHQDPIHPLSTPICATCPAHNRGTHYLIRSNLWTQSAVRPCKSSLEFRVLCCRFVPDFSRCHTTRTTATTQCRGPTNERKMSFLYCVLYAFALLYSLRFLGHFIDISPEMSVVLFHDFPQFLHANACVLLCVHFSFLFFYR